MATIAGTEPALQLAIGKLMFYMRLFKDSDCQSCWYTPIIPSQARAQASGGLGNGYVGKLLAMIIRTQVQIFGTH